ncbi:MAG: aminodeoxychorismate/anthranilate synthase component II [Candidatus Methanomethylophilaceae archaeon]|nr:aminodeoxychorismate/anthranilate synthase component II [Candidatus Methanomethylophilaceae archaeon]
MILIIDKYDCFYFHLYQRIGSMDTDIKVLRNDAVTVEDIDSIHPDAIVLSPGPGRPEDAGVCMDAIRQLGGRYPILGVCLGHQAICATYGATVTYARELMHGKQSRITIKDDPIFDGVPDGTEVARYHSLAADPETIPSCLKVIAETEDGEIMAVRHESYPVYGVQFHPESVMTPEGARILGNFLKIAGDIQ